jgi:hypothetical protein
VVGVVVELVPEEEEDVLPDDVLPEARLDEDGLVAELVDEFVLEEDDVLVVDGGGVYVPSTATCWPTPRYVESGTKLAKFVEIDGK